MRGDISSSDATESKKAELWKLSKKEQDLVDERYKSILGPASYAPRSRLPMQRMGRFRDSLVCLQSHGRPSYVP